MVIKFTFFIHKFKYRAANDLLLIKKDNSLPTVVTVHVYLI